jgi:hypothetical protein
VVAEAAPYIYDYMKTMTNAVASYGVGNSRNGYLGNEIGFCADFLTPGVIIHAGAVTKAAFGAVAMRECRNRYVDRVARVQLPVYLTLLGRWEEIWAAVHDSQSPWYNPKGALTWPFEETKRAAFTHFVDIFNRTDPSGLPASDYAEPRDKTNANEYTFSAGKATLSEFEARVFGYGHFAQMMPMCAPPKWGL